MYVTGLEGESVVLLTFFFLEESQLDEATEDVLQENVGWFLRQCYRFNANSKFMFFFSNKISIVNV